MLVTLKIQVGLITAFSFFRTRLSPDSVTEGNRYFSVVFFSLVRVLRFLYTVQTCFISTFPIITLYM